MSKILDSLLLKDTKTGEATEYQIQDSQLKARVDNLIANAGNTDDNVELIDIRVGEDGTQYPTAGDAVREQVGGLKGDIEHLSQGIHQSIKSDKYIWKNINTTNGGFIESNGRITSFDSGIYSDFIEVLPNDKILVSLKHYGNCAGVTFYSSSKTILGSDLDSGNEQVKNYEVTIPNNAYYIRLSSLDSIKIELLFQFGVIDEIEITNEVVENEIVYKDEFQKLPSDVVNIEQNKFMDNRGTIYSFSGTTLTGYIPVEYMNKYKVTLTYGSSVCGCVFFSDNEGTVVGYKYDSASQITVTDDNLEIPSSAKYFRCSSFSNNIEIKKTVVVKEKIAELEKRKVSNLLGKNVTIIGDSITEGTVTSKNWGMYLEESTGCNLQNLGISSTGFVRYKPYIQRIPQINSTVDIIGVACSFNDLDLNGEYELGNVTDTGSTTICGFVNDFFNELLRQFPTVPIICYIQNPWWISRKGNPNSDALVNAVQTICNKQGIPFYGDLYFNGCTLKPWIDENNAHYFSNSDGVHPNSEGNKIIASYLIRKFEENLQIV